MAKTIFDLIKCISKDKTPWDELQEEDRKDWSTFMINRWLSMDMDLLPVINELQQYTIYMKPELVYKLYLDVLPKVSLYLKYVKKKSADKYDPELINLIKEYFWISKREAMMYIDTLSLNEDYRDELIEILHSFGLNDKQIAKLIK